MSPISVVIAGYARSPFHFARKGALVDIEALLSALVGGVVVHRVVDFLPGTQHGALVVDGGFLLLCLA